MNLGKLIQEKLSAAKVSAFLQYNPLWFIFWMICGATISAVNKFEFLWDFENYHYYNPWKLLDAQNYEIYTPLAATNAFFNPLPEVPLYLLIKYFNDYPTFIYAIQGLWYGGLLFAFHKIAFLFFDQKNYRHIFCFILTMAIAATGQATWFQAGSSTNEVQIAFFIVWGLYYVMKLEKYPDTQTSQRFFWAGIVLGIGLGLKQTSLPYAFGAGISMIVFYKNLKEPLKFISMFVIGGFFGCLAVFGPTMYQNFMDYGNPFMPFLNRIFQSPYYDIHSFQDRRYIPSLVEFLYYPFVWEKRAAEIIFHDWRSKIFYGIMLTSLVYAIVYYIIKRKRTQFFSSALNNYTCVFMLIAYVLWSALFSIFRYVIPLEMLFAVFIVYAMNFCLFRIYRFKWLLIFQIAIFEILMYEFLSVPTHFNWGSLKTERQDQFLYMETVKLPPNTLIKFYNLPSGILAPMLARNNPSFKGVSYVDEGFGINIDFVERTKFKDIRDEVVKNHKGPVIIFAVGDITAEILRKNNYKYSTAHPTVEGYYQIDQARSEARYRHFKNVARRFDAGDHRLSVDIDSVRRFAIEPLSIYKSYKPDNNELFQMYCRPLRTNFRNKRYVVCVPSKQKDTILNPAYNTLISPL